MKRNLFLLICVFVMVSALLASCGPDGSGQQANGECHHAFNTEIWYSDATSHWHPAICDHGEIKDSLADHVDEDQDGFCDVCEYEIGHECSFADEWTVGENHHWYAATCSHSENMKNYDLHSDADADNVCDVCAGHVHSVNIVGKCSVCDEQVKEVENMGIPTAIYAFIDNYGKISGGTVNYEFIGRSSSSSGAAGAKKLIEYTIGNNYIYKKWTSSSNNIDDNGNPTSESDIQELWVEPSGEEYFGVTKINGGRFEITSVSEDSMYNYYYALSNLVDAHGAENILYNLYELAMSAAASDFESGYDEAARTAYFSYNYTRVHITSNASSGEEFVNVNYFVVSVSFSFTENFELTGLDINLDCYTNDAGASDSGVDSANVDLDYDRNTGKVTLRENAKADTYIVKTTQEVGEKGNNPYPKTYFIPDSFDIFTDPECTQQIGSSMDAEILAFNKIYLGNYSPEHASVEYVYDYAWFEVLDADGNVLINNIGLKYDPLASYRSDAVMGYFTYGPSGRYFVFRPLVEGVYTYRIYFVDQETPTHEFTINAKEPKAEDEVTLADNQVKVTVTDTFGRGDELVFTADAAGVYTLTFESNLAFIDADEFDAAFDNNGDMLAPYTVYYDDFDPFADHNKSFDIELSAGEQIRFYVSSDTKGDHVITFNVA